MKRLAHDSFMMGKHGAKAEDVCPTVEEIVKDSTTAEERIGKLGKKTKKEADFITGLSKGAERKIVEKIKSGLGSIGEWF